MSIDLQSIAICVVSLAIHVVIMICILIYHRKNQVRIRQHFNKLALSYSVTLICAFTLFPIFNTLRSPENITTSINLVPLKYIIDSFKSDVSIRLVLFNLWGNIVLFIPFGFVLANYSKKYCNLGKNILIGIILSCLIECLQFFEVSLKLTDYRVTDIDDVLLNLIGSMIGMLFYRILQKPTKIIYSNINRRIKHLSN
jgi:glycopeptide antibiotics resistance protein